MEDPITFSNPSTMLSVKANCVNLIDEGQGPVGVSDVAQVFEGRNLAGHGVDRLERDDLFRKRIFYDH